MALQDAINNIWQSDYVQKNPNKAYKVSYPDEYTAVAAYINGGAEPADWSGFSKIGKGLVEAEKHRRGEVVVEPPPDPDPPPVPVGKGLDFPAKGQKWGGIEGTRSTEVDLLICGHPNNANPAAARASNPKLIAVSHMAWDATDWHKSHAITYGGALSSFPGANDTLSPNPQGSIRAFTASDKGCMQTDGLQGFKIDSTATQDFFKKVFFYEWKLGKFESRGYNGIFSDNLFPASVLGAGWCYGSCGNSINGTAWEQGYLNIFSYIRQMAGKPVMIGGNTVYRTANKALRAATSIAEREVIDNLIGQGADAIWKDMQEMQAWYAEPTVDGVAKVAFMNDRVTKGQDARAKYGWALACCYGCAYEAKDGGDNNTWWPSGVTRGYLGKPLGPATRSGNVFTRNFEHGVVKADAGSKTGTFA